VTLIDEGLIYESNHPFHLHGHSFRVISLEKLGNSTTKQEVKMLDQSGKIYRNLYDPPVKDTVTVPDGGFTIIRFHANNPGYWLMHCHLDFHVEVGMALVFKVGSRKDFPAIPENFPKCGDYYSYQKPKIRNNVKLNVLEGQFEGNFRYETANLVRGNLPSKASRASNFNSYLKTLFYFILLISAFN